MGETARVLQLLGPSTGGIRRHVATLATELTARGWGVEIAGPAGVMEGAGPQHHVVPVPATPHPLDVWRARRALTTVVGGVDLVHAHGLKAGWVAASLRRRPPLVVTVHNLVLDEAAGPAAPVLRALESRLLRRADRVVATSEAVASRFNGVPGHERITVVRPVGPPPVPARRGEEVRRDLGLGPEQPVIATVARLHPQKDLPTLLRAVGKLRERIPGVHLVVVGQGPLDGELRRTAASLGLDAAVSFVGAVDNAADVLAAADVVVVSSLWESGPLVAVEAMRLGRPLVSTPVGFVPELVEDGRSGRLVGIGDSDALASALAEVLQDRERAAALAAAGRAVAEERLGPARLVSLVEDVYRATLAAR